MSRLFDSNRTVAAACLLSLGFGLFFLFVWSPLPWGWEGIDHYHDRAARLATGAPFDTTDVPWGYAYYVAAFYAVFGHHPVVPLVGQVLINATTPLLVYAVARQLISAQEARLAALLTGIFSFNTIYTSTLAADSVCTALFLAVMLAYVRGRLTGRVGWFVGAGLLAGLAAQLRPNLILFPGVMALIELATAPGRRKLVRSSIILLSAGLMLLPWVVRNYRLTQEFLPTSTHGGIQLWYGTLQTGQYLESRAHNPRAAFETPAFDYTSLSNRNIVITSPQPCPMRDDLRLEYWTDRDPSRRLLRPSAGKDGNVQFEIPGQPSPTVVYYRLTTTNAQGRSDRPPAVFFVATAHLEDLDSRDDLLDIFDIVRTMRAAAWKEPLRAADKLDFTRDGEITETDLARAVEILSGEIQRYPAPLFRQLEVEEDAVVMRLLDSSWLRVPRNFSGKVTDLTFAGNEGRGLLYARRSFAEIGGPSVEENACKFVEHLVANRVFYRREPHMMRRYMALAYDNIAREPLAFASATAYRTMRMFIIRGTQDRHTAQQFTASRFIYSVGTFASLMFLAVFVAGAALTLRQYPRAWILLVPALYIPLTIAPVLTNMRYTITVQPFGFMFVAVAVVTSLHHWRRSSTTGVPSSGTRDS